MRLQHSIKALFYFLGISTQLAATFFAYLLLIKIALGVHLLFGIDSVIKNLLKVLNIYKKGSSPAFKQLEVQGIQFAATPATPQATPRLFMLSVN